VFSRGFKREVRVSPTLADETERLLVRAVIEALAMAAKAGQVVSGFTKAEDAIGQRDMVALLHASDGAADGIRKLDAKLDAQTRQTAENTGKSHDVPVIAALTSEELDLALGRSNVIHAAVLAGPAGKTFLSRSQILVRYRTANGGRTGTEQRLR
jgi:hypothetical protein